MGVFTVKMSLSGEYMTTIRLTVGGLCAVAGFDVDSAEDYKVCVTESLLILQRGGFANATLTFTVGFYVIRRAKKKLPAIISNHGISVMSV